MVMLNHLKTLQVICVYGHYRKRKQIYIKTKLPGCEEDKVLLDKEYHVSTSSSCQGILRISGKTKTLQGYL